MILKKYDIIYFKSQCSAGFLPPGYGTQGIKIRSVKSKIEDKNTNEFLPAMTLLYPLTARLTMAAAYGAALHFSAVSAIIRQYPT